jgi:membrane protein YqaA with SNARE-associated domain
MNSKNKLKLFGISISIIVLATFIITFIYKDPLSQYFSSSMANFGPIFIFLGVAFMELVPMYIAPHIIVLNALILGLSPLTVITTAVAGSMIGSIIGFELGKSKGYPLVSSIYSANKIESIRKKFSAYARIIVFAAAISPLPYIPLIFGSLGMSRNHFAFYGILPRMLGYLFIVILL